MTSSPALTPLLALIESDSSSSVEYVIGGKTLRDSARDAAAELLAEDAVEIACGDSPLLKSWRLRRAGGPAHTGSKLRALETYVGIAFGLPSKPANANHLQGHVAELIWNRVIQERAVCRDGRRLVHAHPVKADPLEPGGDGLVIYQSCGGALVFRLWEIKKHETKKTNLVSATIGRASQQLSDRGHEYLAKLAGPETTTKSGPLGDLYADMVELWFDRSARAGVGISVGTSNHHAPDKPSAFGAIAAKFPEFSTAGQTESIVVAVPDFPGFAEQVRGVVWSGL